MADRTSAEIFGTIFQRLAGNPLESSQDVREFTAWLWELAGGYDFSDGQMECHEALAKLGLATVGEDEYGPTYTFKKRERRR